MPLDKTDLPDVADDICQLFNWPSLPPMAVAVVMDWQKQGVSAEAVALAIGEMKDQLKRYPLRGQASYEFFEAIQRGVEHWTVYLAQARVGGR